MKFIKHKGHQGHEGFSFVYFVLFVFKSLGGYTHDRNNSW